MKVDAPVVPDPEHAPGIYEAPRKFIGGFDGRLIVELREAAQTMDPEEILARAAVQFYESEKGPTILDTEADIAFGNALADLAVTGREAYAAFRNLDFTDPTTLDALKDEVRTRLQDEETPPTAGQITTAVDKALDRAYAVAWALRGPASRRPKLRAELGWIAVSGEDDTPHRPVNLPAPPYEQYEIEVAASGVSVSTRFFIASADEELPAGDAPKKREPPKDPEPVIPAKNKVLIFLHGHSSGAEEALEFIPPLLEEGLKRNPIQKYTVISLDLPNNGYSETFDHEKVAGPKDTTYPDLPSDDGPIKTPILDFIEDFVVAFVKRLNGPKAPVEANLEAFIGGSLGGNLGLRLGRRDTTDDPWLAKAKIVSWSPASVWAPMVQDAFKRLAPHECAGKYVEDEETDSRRGYFHDVYEKSPLPGIIKPQTEYWYREDFEYKGFNLWMSKLARYEIYNAYYRRWHWRVACEQLIYSHFDNTTHGDTSTPVRYEKNTLRMLLAAGKDDNFTGTHIYDNTRELGRRMTKTPGRLLPVEESGHSIHFEHPRFFARQVVGFLNARSMQITGVTRTEGRIQRLRGTNELDGTPFDLSVDDCILGIRNGDEFFVKENGQRAWVQVRPPRRPTAGHPRVPLRPGVDPHRGYYLATSPDDTETNNLRSLR